MKELFRSVPQETPDRRRIRRKDRHSYPGSDTPGTLSACFWSQDGQAGADGLQNHHHPDSSDDSHIDEATMHEHRRILDDSTDNILEDIRTECVERDAFVRNI